MHVPNILCFGDVWVLFPPIPDVNVKFPFQGKNMETNCFFDVVLRFGGPKCSPRSTSPASISKFPSGAEKYGNKLFVSDVLRLFSVPFRGMLQRRKGTIQDKQIQQIFPKIFRTIFFYTPATFFQTIIYTENDTKSESHIQNINL